MLLAMVFELPFVIVTGIVLSPGLMLLYWERSRAMAETKEKEGEKGKKEEKKEKKKEREVLDEEEDLEKGDV